MNWLIQLLEQNQLFCQNINTDQLSIARQPCPYAVITCMDPRINLEAIGLRPFKSDGEIQSQVRVIRTLGGIAEDRSLLAGIHMAGFKEIAILMHTDCGGCLAWDNATSIIENMKSTLPDEKLAQFEQHHSCLNDDSLRHYLCAFQDPVDAVKKQVEAIKLKSFMPENIIIHGLVYNLSTGMVDVTVNGYD